MKIVIEHRKSQDEQTQDILLKEYELAQTAFHELEKNTWQTAGIFVVLSIGGVSLLLTRNQHDWTNFFIVTGIGLISILILWLWYGGIYYRWWALQGVFIYRMREIETEIGMWKERYIHYLNVTRTWKRPYALGDEKDRLARLDSEIRHYATASARARMRALVFALILGWILLIIYELILTVPITTWNALGAWLRISPR